MKLKYLKGMVITILCIFLLPGCSIENEAKDTIQLEEGKHGTSSSDVHSSVDNEDAAAVKMNLEEVVVVAEVEVIENKPQKINIKAVGDIMLGRNVAPRLNGDYTYPFHEVAEFLGSADITFANLETTLSTRGERLIGKGVWLRAEPKAVKGIKYAGVDIVNIANNHILDYNEIAMIDTVDTLEKNDLFHIGAGMNLNEARKPAILEVDGMKVGFLGYTDLYQYGYGVKGQKALRYLEAKENVSGVAPLKYDLIQEDVRKLRNDVDILVVSLHWGIEESHKVPPEQREFAHNILNDGADVILGHHPHQLQGIEMYNGKPIVYSMGNFIFDQNDKENNETVIVDMDFTDGRLSRFEIVPCKIVGKKRTVYAKGEDAAHILGYMRKFAEKLNTETEIKDGKLLFKIAP